MHIDIQQVAQAALSAYPGLLSQMLPGGRKDGHEYKCGDLNGGKGESLSVNVRTGKWADFASGDKGGDAVSLYAAIHKLSQIEAAKELASLLGLSNDPAVHRDRPVHKYEPKPEPVEEWQQVVPAPDTLPDMTHRKLGKPSRYWCYRTNDGQVIGYVCRFDKQDGSKETLPRTYRKHRESDKRLWAWKSFDAPRPMYNLPALSAKPNANVVIVEGEKTADAAQALLPFPVVTWPGGGKAVSKVDWTPLAGRKVIVIPDADKPGFSAAENIAANLRNIGCDVKFVTPPADVPEGWDLADVDWTPEQTLAFVKANICDQLPAWPDPIPEPEPSYDAIPYDIEDRSVPAEPIAAVPAPRRSYHVMDDAPFRCLGHDRDHYYYFAEGKQCVVALTPSAHTKANLIGIASHLYWVSEFKKGRGDDFEVDAAVNAMMRRCEQIGFFDPSKIRGRGAWYDAGRVVVHLGDRVIVDQEEQSPSRVYSNYIYERGATLTADLSRPLSNKEAYRFIDLMEMLSWQRPMDAKLAAGWCVCAHIGGVLKWRPHIWVVGKKGSGKTYVISNIIKAVMGDNSLFIQAGSTEAGIRQNLGSDALPVLFDEAEGEDHRAHENIQRVLQLVRQSSSDTGGMIAKGTPGGRALHFHIRSCFAFSSINANLVQQSDKSRVTVVELDTAKSRFEFSEIVACETELLTQTYISRFYARAIALAPVIRMNAVTFARAAAYELGEQRAGDQMGALLAGAYALHSDKAITLEDAVAWVRKQDWTETKDELKGMSDEEALWSYLMQQKIRIKLDGQGTQIDMPIGMAIDVAMDRKQHASIGYQTAHDALLENGIKTEGSKVYVSNTSPYLARLLTGTTWAVNWGRVLRRLPGAEAAGVVYFGYSGSNARATMIPIQ